MRVGAMIASLLLVILAAPGAASAAPPKIAVAFTSSAEELPREAIRAAIATELGLTLVEDVFDADGVLTVSVADDGRLALSYRPNGARLERQVPEPRHRADLPRMIALLAGNLVRNEAVELLAKAPQAPPEDPFVEAPVAAAPAVVATPRRPFLLTFALGSGYGWSKGTPEVNATDSVGRKLHRNGFDPAALLHLAPEVGYRPTERLILSMQLRLQFVTGTTDVYRMPCPSSCLAPGFALAVLGRVGLSLPLGERAELLPSMAIGIGRVRHVFTIENLADCGASQRETCVDSVAGGPALLGPGVMFLYTLRRELSLVAGLSSLLGVPDTMVNFDLTAGLAWRL
jgi:hypothetical protein